MSTSAFRGTILLFTFVGASWCGAQTLGHSAAGAASSQDEGEFETATFSMFCYWTGEATVGRVDGVLASRIGHWDGREIVQVDFDPQQTSVDGLAAALGSQRSLYAVHHRRGEPAPRTRAAVKSLRGEPHFIDAKYSLRTVHPEIAALDLSENQAIALNSWAYFGGPMPDVLTAEQKAELARRALP